MKPPPPEEKGGRERGRKSPPPFSRNRCRDRRGEERFRATLSGIERVVVLEQEAHQRVPAVEEEAPGEDFRLLKSYRRGAFERSRR